MHKKNNTAFSLIEISIVLIIIGILVAGITQSRKLITQTKINSARSNTMSSPILSTQGLLAWYETVLEQSFLESQQQDMVQISNWLDLNTTSQKKNNFTQSNVNNQPIYILNGINNLPSLEFSGNNFMEIAYDNLINPVSFSIFMVIKVKNLAPSNISTILCNNSANRGFMINSFLNSSIPNYQIAIGDNATLNSQNITSSGNSFNKTDMITIIHSGTSVATYYNSNNSISFSNNFAINIDKKLTLGVNNCNLSLNNFFQGQIGEIIIFERNLKSEERIAIEKYLARKWDIKI